MNKSKEKGSRFERRVAKLFSEVFNRKLRRTPLSGGHSIKSDIYDPDNDNFPYFIECKYRESYNINSILNGTSPLFKVYERTLEECNKSEFTKKYEIPPVPLVIFKGGQFNSELVLLGWGDYVYCAQSDVIIRLDKIVILPLYKFLENCTKDPLELKPKEIEIQQEDDGYCD